MSDLHSAIGFEEADQLFVPLKRFAHLVLAVSGGPDSLALLQLLAEWRLRHNGAGPSMSVATVDHRLRDASALEAASVAQHAARLGLTHAILTWDDDKPFTGLPEAARDARYRLLEAHVLALHCGQPAALVTGHTQDDQAETVIMRLKRGAGVDGLSAMPHERPLSPGSSVCLVRPLLDSPKTRLMATLQVRGIAWCDDPTNNDMAYERVRVRNALRVLDNAGIVPSALALTARRMREAREAIDYAADAFMASLGLSFHDGIFAELERQAFDAGPMLLRQRVMARLVERFGGATHAAELSEIESLVVRMAQTPMNANTLGGASISSGERHIRVWREAGRVAEAPLVLEPGERRLWDQRFWVSVPADAPPGICVGALGEAGYRHVVGLVGHELPGPSRAAYALPAFSSNGVLLAVPQLGFLPAERRDGQALCATKFASDPVDWP